MSVQQDMLGILMAFGLQRVAELLRDPTVGDQDERRKWVDVVLAYKPKKRKRKKHA